MNKKKQPAILQAVLAALTYDPSSFSSHIHIFLPAPADSISLFCLSKHVDLFYSHLISTHLFQFLLADALHHVTVLWLSANGPDALRKDHRESLLQSLQPAIFPIVPTPLSTHESQALTALGLEWDVGLRN